MGRVLLSLYFLLLKWFVIIIKAEETNITFPTILNETDITYFNKTSILRYGFHRTHKCMDFKKTSVCINACLVRGFAIASADKNCKCTCFKDKIKSKYIGVNSAWKLPTTSIPAWAVGYLNQSKGKFVLVHSPHEKYDNLKHQINTSLSETNEPALYENNSSEQYHNETNSDGENEDAGGVTTEKEDNVTTVEDVTIAENVNTVKDDMTVENVTTVKDVTTVENVTTVKDVTTAQNVTTVEDTTTVQDVTTVASAGTTGESGTKETTETVTGTPTTPGLLET